MNDAPKAPMKIATHFVAGAIAAVIAFAATPAGHALVQQYPKLAPIAAGLGMIAALYHSPRES